MTEPIRKSLLPCTPPPEWEFHSVLGALHGCMLLPNDEGPVVVRRRVTYGDWEPVRPERWADEPVQPAPAAAEAETTTRVFAALHRSAEQDVSRVIALYEQWVKAGPPPLGMPMSRWWDARLVELHDAILPPTDQPKEQ